MPPIQKSLFSYSTLRILYIFIFLYEKVFFVETIVSLSFVYPHGKKCLWVQMISFHCHLVFCINFILWPISDLYLFGSHCYFSTSISWTWAKKNTFSIYQNFMWSGSRDKKNSPAWQYNYWADFLPACVTECVPVYWIRIFCFVEIWWTDRWTDGQKTRDSSGRLLWPLINGCLLMSLF